jgi:hypothetical protein
VFVDNDFPKLLGAELYRPHPAYVVEMAAEPVVVHDFSKQPGQTVQLDRYRFWGNPGSKESRERTAEQTIGTANSRNVVKDKVLVTLREYTGPADPSDPTQPSTFKVARETLITAQRLLLDTGNLTAFHQSIGSLTMLDDYRRWRDRVFINELLKAVSKGQSSDSQGGYYYPGDLAVGSLTYSNAEQAKFDVKDDLLRVVKSMRKRNVPTYQDGFYRCVCDPTFLMHLRQNSDFREVARYPGNGQINPLMSAMQPNGCAVHGSGLRSSHLRGWRADHAHRFRVRRRSLLRIDQHALSEPECHHRRYCCYLRERNRYVLRSSERGRRYRRQQRSGAAEQQ